MQGGVTVTISSADTKQPLKKGMKTATRILILTVIILMQLAVLVKVGFDKKEYHIDEIYSYLLSNSYDADRISNDDSKWDQWVSGSEFYEFITVQDGEQFSYDKVFYNNSLDAHPPLFYCIIHTICSLFPGQFSKWIGLILNMLIMVGLDILLYKISRKIISSEVMQFLPVFVYSLSPVAIETASFIRMYMLLTFFSVAFCYCTICMLKDGASIKRLIPAWLIIYLGAMTHYYALVICFWGVLLFEIYLIKKKDIKHMLINGVGSLVAVAMVYVTYPSILTQAFGSSTNGVGKDISGSFFDVRFHLRQIRYLVLELIEGFAYRNWGYIVCAVIALIMIALLVYAAAKKGKSAFKMSKESIWVLCVFFLTFLTVGYVGGHYVSLRYTYLVLPLIYVFVGCFIDRYTRDIKAVVRNGIICLVAAYTLGICFYGTWFKLSPYLFLDTAESDEILADYSDCRLIVICTGHYKETAVPTGNFMKIMNFNDVYLTTKSSLEQNNVFAQCLAEDEQFVVYIGTDEYWLEEDNLDPYETISELSGDQSFTYTEITDGTLGQFYLIKKN